MIDSFCTYRYCQVRIPRDDLVGRCHEHQPVSGRNPMESRNSDGEIRAVRWRNDSGRTDRHDGPAATYFEDGVRTTEEWRVCGELHRVGGPAVTFFENGDTPVIEEWCRDGLDHRVDGPARFSVRHRRNSFVLDGAVQSSAKALGWQIGQWSELRRLREFTLSSYVTLLDEGATTVEIAEVQRTVILSVSGIREVLGGAPVDWVRAYESAEAS